MIHKDRSSQPTACCMLVQAQPSCAWTFVEKAGERAAVATWQPDGSLAARQDRPFAQEACVRCTVAPSTPTRERARRLVGISSPPQPEVVSVTMLVGREMTVPTPPGRHYWTLAK